jgi:hypothetical protein
MPELIPAPYFPLVRAVEAAPAAQTEHCAAVHKGQSRIIREKNILEIFFTVQIYENQKL